MWLVTLDGMGGPESLFVPGAATAGPVGDRELRVSDAEREHVGQLLQRAVGLGMLSLGEFTERMDTALAAKTRGELNAVLVDLPGMRVAGTPQPAGAGRCVDDPRSLPLCRVHDTFRFRPVGPIRVRSVVGCRGSIDAGRGRYRRCCISTT